MLVFPQWRPELASEGCRVPRWMPAERFAPYVARRVTIPPSPPQVEDDESTGGSSPESSEAAGQRGEVPCGWRACGARLASVPRLSAHVARAHAHAHTDGLFYCHWAGCTRPQKGFNARYKMLVHVRTHTNERPHTCNQCHKSFSRAENLKIHLRSHSGEKPYVCPYEGCGKAYSNSSDRFKHTRTHTVDKPYCCKVLGCNKRYTDPSSLRKHVKTYKHFTPKGTMKPDSSDDTKSPDRSHRNSLENITYMHTEPTSPSNIIYSPAQASLSPPYNPILQLAGQPLSSMEYAPEINQIKYIRPIEPMYPVRIPSSEMTYIEYTQMYERAYRSYNSSSYTYPVVSPTVCDKSYCYDERPHKGEIATETTIEREISPDYTIPEEDMPLNLIKCDKNLEFRPIEELVTRTDVPLDLSIRIDVESL